MPCRAVPPAPPEPAPPLGLRRLHDVRPGGAQLPRPEGEVAPAALENGMHGGLLSAEQKAGGGGGKRQEAAEGAAAEAAEPLSSRLFPHGAHGSGGAPGTAAPWCFRFPGRGAPAAGESWDASGRALPAGRREGIVPFCSALVSPRCSVQDRTTWSSWSGSSGGQRKLSD